MDGKKTSWKQWLASKSTSLRSRILSETDKTTGAQIQRSSTENRTSLFLSKTQRKSKKNHKESIIDRPLPPDPVTDIPGPSGVLSVSHDAKPVRATHRITKSYSLSNAFQRINPAVRAPERSGTHRPESRSVKDSPPSRKSQHLSFDAGTPEADVDDISEGGRRAISMDTVPNKGLKLSHLVRGEYMDISTCFKFQEELGQGLSGMVWKCAEIATGAEFACKSIAKSNLRCQLDIVDLKAEVRTLRIMQEHPAVVGLKGIFEDPKSVHIVMDYCEGGDLFNRVKERKFFTEREAAMVCRRVASVLAFAHERGIMHRDLKPENILLASKDDDCDIRVADFGSATFFKPGQRMNQLVGSPLYISPSVLQHSYGPEADLWSLGVVLYILLSGMPPFWGESNAEIFRSVLTGDLDLDRGRWRRVSVGAKRLVARLLNRDEKSQLSAVQVLKHPWIVHHCLSMGGGEESSHGRTQERRRSRTGMPPAAPVGRPPRSERKEGSRGHRRSISSSDTSGRRRHSLGSSQVEAVSFASHEKVYSVEVQNKGRLRSVLTRSATPFRSSSEVNEEEEEGEGEESVKS